MSAHPEVGKLLLSAKEVAKLVGLDPETVRRWDAAGRMPAALRIGKGWTRWRRADVEAWVAMGCPGREAFETRRAMREGR